MFVFFGVISLLSLGDVAGINQFFAELQRSQILFASLLLFYAALWFTYFVTAEVKFLHAQTLRLFLREEAGRLAEASEAVLIDRIRDKSRSVLTMQAILIAVSVFVLNSIHSTAADEGATAWQSLTGQLALILVTLSIVNLFIAVDASDTTFNGFTDHELRKVTYFQNISLKRKYYGFVFSALAIIVLVSRISAGVAALGLVTFIFSGFRLWFPQIDMDDRDCYVELGLLVVLTAISAIYLPVWFEHASG